jgi:uncharacterized repeat protein (TIGR02543 family)
MDMKNKNKIRCIIAVIIVITASLLLSSCGISDEGVDPASWGYDCTVIYDALGGTVNSREIRETYYMNNSYLFKPAGTTNMLIEPVRDGYILAGWYTAKEDVKDQDGNVIGYSFRAEDRWDFDEDRVQGDMTLYARWIPQGKVQYVDIDTGEVVFTKNITADSPIQPLSGAAESLIAKSGYTFYGYFADDAGTIPYDFTTYVHQDLIPSNEEVYALLYEKFPQYFSRVEYVEPPEDEEIPLEEDTSHLFFNKLGYELTTDARLYGINKGVSILTTLLKKYLVKMHNMLIDAVKTQSCFHAPSSYDHIKSLVQGYIGTGAKMGEGWLLTAEMIDLVNSGVDNIICTQPFGCLPNHISGKGMIRKIKGNYHNANIVAIDYDPGATRINQENRIKLMLSVARLNLLKRSANGKP